MGQNGKESKWEDGERKAEKEKGDDKNGRKKVKERRKQSGWAKKEWGEREKEIGK